MKVLKKVTNNMIEHNMLGSLHLEKEVEHDPIMFESAGMTIKEFTDQLKMCIDSESLQMTVKVQYQSFRYDNFFISFKHAETVKDKLEIIEEKMKEEYKWWRYRNGILDIRQFWASVADNRQCDTFNFQKRGVIK